ncbi:uncharacterized protein LOC115758166 [Drosophila novamexicana]|uniref:uncharacterized protein LOC115757803 n=1 Tax=Drosophila novamexicana TaxID=47314 RepID=UPI0011E59368|nr:uncharacterized protein LOC115757803 [Drosophila novamexicana]XP_030554567.1 uncharacterized protein LOC115758166 [Drosophila novamexicana]
MPLGRITKLNVNIDKCQTHISYEDYSTRFVMNNPSGFVFRSKGNANCRCCQDCASQAVGFLKRHFGLGGSITKTPSLCNLLLTVGLDEYAFIEVRHIEEPSVSANTSEHEQSQLHTWHMEELPLVLPQRATKLERIKGKLQVLSLAWHLDSCKCRNFTANDYALPKCHCLKIKETMDYINEVVGEMPTQEQQEEEASKSDIRIMPDMNANIIGINALLQKLSELLEEQNYEQGNVPQ